MSDLEVLFQGSRFSVVRQSHRTPDGVVHQRETICHPGAVTILPMLDQVRVCLIRNLRPAVGDTLIELPAGTLEPGESPQETAFRELEEETGYRASVMEPLCSFWMSPGIVNEQMHLFVARELTLGENHLDAGEVIEPLVLPWAEAMQMVRSGAIHDAKTMVALLYYDHWKSAES